MMVKYDNTLENSQLCTYFTKNYRRTYNNTSVKVLKIVTVKNGTKFQ